MQSYFYEMKNDKRVLKESLLTTQAIGWAKSFIKPAYPKDRREQNPKLNMAQLRRYFNEVRSLESKVKATSFDEMRPLIKMLKSKVALACPSNGRDRKVPVEFRNYIDEMVDKIESEKDFDAFMKCFEAVVGFFIGEGGR